MRKTKIIATIGPTSSDPDTLDKLVGMGLDCVRLNFSHGTLEEHGRIIRTVRELSDKYQRPVSVLQDLGGIKLRLGQMAEPVQLVPGGEVYLVPEDSSDQASILPFPQPEVLRSLQPGDLVYLSDGTVCLEVVEIQDSGVKTRVLNASALLSSYKGVNLPGVSIDQPVLTEDDKVALRYGVGAGVDWVAVSFVRSVEDIHYAKDFLNSIGSTASVMAKLERREGIENLLPILEEVDGVMVARGDLGVEIPMERVPIVQKNIVKQANEVAKVSVIATQMLRSMVVSPNPTRAEISDITNAVLDGCDAILLSDETAVGAYPVEAVRVAQATILEAETVYPYYRDFDSGDRTQSIASAAGRLVQELRSKPIVITSTGRAAYAIARSRPDSDILVFSHDVAVLRRLCLGWGLYPMGVIPAERDVAKLVSLLVKGCLDSGMVSDSDVVIIVHGFLPGVSGTTNTIQVLDMSQYLNRSA